MPKVAEPIKNVREKIDNSKIVDEFRQIGGKILHVQGSNRSMTLAFIPKNGRVEVATSIVHRNDTFTKKIGTKLAIESFHSGKFIALPIAGRRVTRALQSTFSYLVGMK